MALPPGGGDFFRPVGAAGGSMPRPYKRKNPPFPEKRGISITFCSSRYAERRPSYPYNAGSHVFYSSFDKHHVGQFGSRHCRATGRAVSARLTARKIHQARVCPQGLPAKIPRFRRTGGSIFSMTSAVRPTVFYSSFDKQRVGQFASGGSPLRAGGQRRPEPCPRRCRCTSRSS